MQFKLSFASIVALFLSQSHDVVASASASTSTKKTGTSLIKKAIVTRTDISRLADITNSVRTMHQKCYIGDYVGAYAMYTNSDSSKKYNLKELATSEKFQNTGLTFAFQMYGLTGGKFDEYNDKTPYTNFADVYIESLLKENNVNNTNCLMAATAALWQVLFMQANYELWGGMKDCSISGNPNYNNDAAGIPDHNAKADEFMAYWVGSLNDSLETKSNDSLYSSTNEIAAYFGTNQHGVANANLNIIEGYESLSALLSDDDACDVDMAQSTLRSMWIINNSITPQMRVPLIQHLIKSMLDKNHSMIDVYAKMLVPQMAQCRHSKFEFLKENLLDKDYNENKIHDIMKALQDSYGCLGITCEDIGAPNDQYDSLLSCSDTDYSKPKFAGYQATVDVRQEANMDLDLHQMNILMSFDSDHYWSMAQRIYTSGKNSVESKVNADDDSFGSFEFRSLHSMAISELRKGTLFFNEILTYHDNNPYYADMLITDIFNNDNKIYESLGRDVKAAIISSTILTHIVYVYVLGEMNDAITHCRDRSDGKIVSRRGNPIANLAWDQVAAYTIGSLEGSSTGGSDDFTDGVFLWSLANKRGIEFDRRTDDGSAVVNSAVENLLLSGKGQLSHQSCMYLERTSKNIAYMLLIPIVQTMVKYALSNEYLAFNDGDAGIYVGEIYAKLLIPVYRSFGADTEAKILQKNMIPNFKILVEDGPQAVADTFLEIADDIGIQCEYIGKSFEVDACLNYKPTMKTPTSDASTISNSMIGGISASLIGLVLLILS